MKGQKTIYPHVGGQFMEITENKEKNALPFIEKRIEYFLPIETVDVEEVKKLLRYINVKVNRDCTMEEVQMIVNQIRGFLADALDQLPKHERYNNGTKEGAKHDDDRS